MLCLWPLNLYRLWYLIVQLVLTTYHSVSLLTIYQHTWTSWWSWGNSLRTTCKKEKSYCSYYESLFRILNYADLIRSNKAWFRISRLLIHTKSRVSLTFSLMSVFTVLKRWFLRLSFFKVYIKQKILTRKIREIFSFGKRGRIQLFWNTDLMKLNGH